jgi:hypothetical protein
LAGWEASLSFIHPHRSSIKLMQLQHPHVTVSNSQPVQ